MLVILYRRPEHGSSYYYTLDDRQQNLFNPYSLTVSWGKHAEGGRQKTYIFETLDAKNRMIRSLLSKKLRTYKVLYSFFKEMQEKVRESRTDAAGTGMDDLGPYQDWARRG